MKCPSCGFEPRDRLLSSPCPNVDCKFIWVDSEDFVRRAAAGLSIKSALDVGSGLKGVIAKAYWREIGVSAGYACDRHVLKPTSPPWVQLLCDVEKIQQHPAFPGVVDFTTTFGTLEHLHVEKALRILDVLEQITNFKIVISCSAVLRDVDYKVKRDGNPYHYYKSWWDAATFEALGYTVERELPRQGKTFTAEVITWCEPRSLPPFETRWRRAARVITDRRCDSTGCLCEPIGWDSTQYGNHYYCVKHFIERCQTSGVVGDSESRLHDVLPWTKRDDADKQIKLAAPKWREPLKGYEP